MTMTNTGSAPQPCKPNHYHQAGNMHFNVFSFDAQSGIDMLYDRRNYRIIFLQAGQIEWRSSDRKFSLAAQAVGMLKPTQPFHLHAQCDSCGYILCFSYEFMQAALNSAGLAQEFHLRSSFGKVSIPDEDSDFLSDVVSRLRQEYRANRGLKDQILQGLFQVIVLYLNRITTSLQPQPGGRSSHHIDRFFALLDEHFIDLKMPADYASLLSLSPSYLNCLIKKTYGYNTSYFIQQRILSAAKKMMAVPGMTMKEIAYELGFVDVSHFSKFFKRNAGESYTDFRRAGAA